MHSCIFCPTYKICILSSRPWKDWLPNCITICPILPAGKVPWIKCYKLYGIACFFFFSISKCHSTLQNISQSLHPLTFLKLLVCIISPFLLSLPRSLSIPSIFSRNKLYVSLIFFYCFVLPILFIPAICTISFLQLALGYFTATFSMLFKWEHRLSF